LRGKVFIKTEEEEEIMKTKSLCIVIAGILVFWVAGPAHSWQGRMGGMGDPYGLVVDESDFLIHPAIIAKDKGINYYGDFRFTWTDVGRWQYNLTGIVPSNPGCVGCHNSYKASGHESRYEGQLGAAFPLGPGRMGMFFQYSGKRSNFNGDGVEDLDPNQFNLQSDLDSFALRLLYGLPMGGVKLGGEVQLAYRHEKNESVVDFGLDRESLKNGTFLTMFYSPETLPLMFPYDSKYWEALFKGSLGGALGPAKFAFTIQGGFIFGGDNKMKFEWVGPDTPFDTYNVDANGSVKGWRVGGDLWVRYPLKDGLSLPFLLRVAYQDKTRKADGPGLDNGVFDIIEESKIREKNFNVEVGGGVDKEFGKGTRVASGIYYNYLNNKNGIWGYGIYPGGVDNFENPRLPNYTENQIIFRLAGEKEICPVTTLRMGLNFFYGWVKEEYNSTTYIFSDKINLDGSRWGIGASLGGTIKFNRFILEPFLGGGYQAIRLSGDGSNPVYLGGPLAYDMERSRRQWSIATGFSIKFNPPPPP
jgi:hypothetical protein